MISRITDQPLYDSMKAMANSQDFGDAQPFIRHLWDLFNRNLHYGTLYSTIRENYEKMCGFKPEDAESFDDFFNPKLLGALRKYFGDEQTDEILEECRLIMASPYDPYAYRASYRSSKAGDYAELFHREMVRYHHYLCCDRHGPLSRFKERIALDLSRGNGETLAAIEAAITGEALDSNRFGEEMVQAMVMSGNPKALELLGKLVLGAKLQEGLRQCVFEAFDSGTIQGQIYFLHLALDNNLTRFPSVIKAFDKWTMRLYEYPKQEQLEKLMALAVHFLEDGENAIKAIESPDITEMYMGLWALACRDICLAIQKAKGLIESPEISRRLLGWHFVTNTGSDNARHTLASACLDAIDDRFPEELAWILRNVKEETGISPYWNLNGKDSEEDNASKTYPDSVYPDTIEGRSALFAQALSLAKSIGNKRTRFASSLFPWISLELSSKPLFTLMACLVGYDRDPDLTMRFADNIRLCDPENRFRFYVRLLNPNEPGQREILLRALSDRNQTIRQAVLDRLSNYPLGEIEVCAIEKSLASASGDSRKDAIRLLSSLDGEMSAAVIESLLGGKGTQALAGVELLEIQSQAHPELIEVFSRQVLSLRQGEAGAVFGMLASRMYPEDPLAKVPEPKALDANDPDPKETDPKEQKTLTPENGFGLYDPYADEFKPENWAGNQAYAPISDSQLFDRLVLDTQEAIALYWRLFDVWERNRDYEYETTSSYGRRFKTRLGNSVEIHRLADFDPDNPKGICDYPLADQWRQAVGEHWGDPEKTTALLAVWAGFRHYYYKNECLDWYAELFAGLPVAFKDNRIYQAILGIHVDNMIDHVNMSLFNGIIKSLAHGHDLFGFAMETYVSLIDRIPTGLLAQKCILTAGQEPEPGMSPAYNKSWETSCLAMANPYLDYWRQVAYENIKSDEEFALYFTQMYFLHLASGSSKLIGISEGDALRAHSMRLFSDQAFCRYLLSNCPTSYGHPLNQLLDNADKPWQEEYPEAKLLADKAISAVVMAETQRGELAGPFSSIVGSIGPFTGTAMHFASLLGALGDARFSQVGYLTRDEPTKRDSISHLLKNCFPVKGEDPGILRDALLATRIPENRILQAALFAPQWAGVLEAALGIGGLKSGVWFFHAHASESLFAQKETEVAIFSSGAITMQQFGDGLFDQDWFHSARNALGEERFAELNRNANLVPGSKAAHRRVQLYTQAALGNLDKAQTLSEIQERRDLELLKAYAVIPLDPANANDALERYECINRFAKQGRQLGASRQASEGKAVDTALDNLALTAGYADADRLTWALEGQRTGQLASLALPRTIGQYQVQLRLGTGGDGAVDVAVDIEVTKNGKTLKSIPKELAKDEYLLDLKAAAKSLKEQHSRARGKLETAMLSRSVFAADEILDLLDNPIVGKSLSRLVFANGDVLGFPVAIDGGLGLRSFDGNVTGGIGEAIIAHPYDFIKNNCYSEYQRAVFDARIKQPFKQVFREYYPLTEDELSSAVSSSRYQGHQVQPAKTLALLKTRGWSVDHNEGLQKVWHRENLIAHAHANADWFSASDIEAPTLGSVVFTRRGGSQEVPFAEISPVIFSETMRDLDLAVSVAHVGMEEHESSQSTVQMRTAIAEELLRLLGVGNVSFAGSHATVAGQCGEYSVHMGSGIVHKAGTGMIAISQVHSNSEPEFLPFEDDDPKTAEIVAKILLLSEDAKIKDPGIASQIRGV